MLGTLRSKKFSRDPDACLVKTDSSNVSIISTSSLVPSSHPFDWLIMSIFVLQLSHLPLEKLVTPAKSFGRPQAGCSTTMQCNFYPHPTASRCILLPHLTTQRHCHYLLLRCQVCNGHDHHSLTVPISTDSWPISSWLSNSSSVCWPDEWDDMGEYPPVAVSSCSRAVFVIKV